MPAPDGSVMSLAVEHASGVAVAGVAPGRRSSPALCTAAASYSPALARQLTPLHRTTLLLDDPLTAALNKHRHRLSASPCRAKVAKGAARHISVTPYPARKDTRASGPLAPLELPGEEMPGCLGARTLGYYHCNKEPDQPVGRHALRGVCLGPPVFFLLVRTRIGLALLGRTGS